MVRTGASLQARAIPGSNPQSHHRYLGRKAARQSVPSSTRSSTPPFISFKSLLFHVSMFVCIHLNLRRSLHLSAFMCQTCGIPFAFFKVLTTKPPGGKTQDVQHRTCAAARPLGGWESGKEPARPPWPHLARCMSASLPPALGQPTCCPPGLGHVPSLATRPLL